MDKLSRQTNKNTSNKQKNWVQQQQQKTTTNRINNKQQFQATKVKAKTTIVATTAAQATEMMKSATIDNNRSKNINYWLRCCDD